MKRKLFGRGISLLLVWLMVLSLLPAAAFATAFAAESVTAGISGETAPYAGTDSTSLAGLTVLTGANVPDNEAPDLSVPKSVTVYFTLQGLNSGSGKEETWIRSKAVTMTGGSTVADAVIKALEGSGYTQSGAKEGYIKSVTTPDGFILSDETYDSLPRAGWLYKVNAQPPTVGIDSYVVNNGDQILLYFTEDYMIDFDAGDFSGGSTPGSTIPVDGETPLNDSPQPGANPFADVESGAWYYDDVLWAYESGLIIGTDADRFSPNATLTRAMIVTILYRREEEPDTSGLDNPFDDVAAGLWYTDAVTWAAENGIVTGKGNGKFDPGEAVTRQDLATILMRYMVFLEISFPVTLEYVFFADEAGISGYAMEAIQIFYKLGIIKGIGANENGQAVIDPKGSATRAQAAAMLHRFVEVIIMPKSR